MQFDNGLPIYLQIVKEMTLRALSGAMEPGEKIPPVRELAAQFGVNPNTMQRAMVEMERDGLVYTERTSGRFLTKEEQVLAEKRKAFAREETKKYLDYMKKIGFTTEEVAAYVKALGEKGEETT
ncbi:GntR family transcriptional regulator [Anaerotignum lactatifermentans]